MKEDGSQSTSDNNHSPRVVDASLPWEDFRYRKKTHGNAGVSDLENDLEKICEWVSGQVTSYHYCY